MSELDQSSNGGLGLAFLLSEMRDFRKGLEARDERINGSIDGLRQDVNNLSTALTQSQDHVSAIETDVKGLREDMSAVRVDVDGIIAERHAEQVRAESEWSGPKKVLRTLALVGTGVGGLIAIWTLFGPSFVALVP